MWTLSAGFRRGGRACIARDLPVRLTNETRDETETKTRVNDRNFVSLIAFVYPTVVVFCVENNGKLPDQKYQTYE